MTAGVSALENYNPTLWTYKNQLLSNEQSSYLG